MPFIDRCKIYIKAGNGGNGIVSWRHEAHVPEGGPAGGNGGNGGDIYFVGNYNETSLEFLMQKKKVIAKNGGNGDIKNMHGADAENIYIKVPLGTIVRRADNNEIIADVLVHNEEYLIASGGRGGHGNASFKSNSNKAPTLYENGEKGETFDAILELKQISDVGLIGLPNAGKSSLISCLTNARPKIADYQFTTLIPSLGVINGVNRNIVIADIPGLIKGASEGIGLGHEFLRHIERCKILCHVISLSNYDNENILDAANIIFNELNAYNKTLLDKEIIIIANKSDEPEAEENFNLLKKHFKNYKIFKTSCLTDEGLVEFKDYLLGMLDTPYNPNTYKIINWTPPKKNPEETLDKTITIKNPKPHIFEIYSPYLEYWTNRVPINTPDNLIRLNQKIANTSMFDDLKKLGIEEGDTINIYGVTFNYEK